MDFDTVGLTSALTRRYADYWLSLPRDGLVPRRSSFDPAAVPELLPRFIMHEIVDRTRLRLRLVGTALVERYGMDITGRDYLEFVPPERRDIALTAMLKAVDHPAGMLTRMILRTTEGRIVQSESLGLPLKQEDGKPPIILFQSEETESLGYQRDELGKLEKFGLSERVWIDLGNGVPDDDPREVFVNPESDSQV